ncbi:DUF4254 domain-containing protein [Nocardia sp. NPDC057353]|uniref:DUF4254 domain-containing protein n=1 Tax=Nocardia sp. NPDC057353 TaxID=3346104 RepID=UPI0036430A0B
MDVLPTGHELSAAILGGHRVEHPLISFACALAKLHRKRWRGTEQVVAAHRRQAVLDAIDLWMATNVGSTTALQAGSLIDEMTRAGARARYLLATADPASETVHAAWTAAAALADQWSELAVHVTVPYACSTRWRSVQPTHTGPR